MNKLNGIAKESISQSSPSMQAEVELRPIDNSDLPALANFAAAQAMSGLVFVDFGFLDFHAIQALSRLASSDSTGPTSIRGRLACRVALSGDAVASLARQLNQLLQPRHPEGANHRQHPEGRDTAGEASLRDSC